MRRLIQWVGGATFLTIAVSIYSQDQEESPSEAIVEEVVVSAQATITSDPLTSLSSAVLDKDQIEAVQAVHPHELLVQVPGVWISRGSGQEHLTAMRSGVLTGAGACGAYLLLENGIPIRPASFCNVNGLFELNTEQAQSIEVLRGPASSRFGGNALHGVINSVNLGPTERNIYSLQVGSNSYSRIGGEFASESLSISGHATETGGWRDDTGYAQHKLNGHFRAGFGSWKGTHTLSYTSLNQETGGYVVGLDGYKDETLRFSNPNPEAFRDAESIRLASHWRKGKLTLKEFLRHSSMDFLMHFLPGQPLEHNEQTSGGALAHWDYEFDQWSVSFGVQGELARIKLSEVQVNPTVGSAFLVATRPMGTHYDFSVNAKHLGLFHDGTRQASDRTTWQYRIRLESANYSYDNLHLDGNTKDDGTNCGFGGCLYSRPADRQDSFVDAAFQVGVEVAVSQRATLHGLVGTGFRPPQVAELYRLQSGQAFTDIDSEALRAFEIGFTREAEETKLSLIGYVERSRDLILRDAEGFNQSGGRVNSSGVEARVELSVSDNHAVRVNHSLARHVYDYTQDLARREVIVAGNYVDTAPKNLGSMQWRWRIGEALKSDLEINWIGAYFMDAANTLEYPGHVVTHWRGYWQASAQWEISAHVRNLLDKQYADRADWSFGNPRYFPAMPRSVQVGFARYF